MDESKLSSPHTLNYIVVMQQENKISTGFSAIVLRSKAKLKRIFHHMQMKTQYMTICLTSKHLSRVVRVNSVLNPEQAHGDHMPPKV